ncbi:MAG TPA: bifunctional lysine ketoglutarate reductase /saccharopine dehydrogenase family protein [Pseudobacteroides sp.]|uniref:bifunctional lysine ketoglutarate reductase /saccharopine dehydrogenase family protein n=1 Tax=Pseudobacteroides sp. TaxID=1968840 RepID=UPI002F952606
MNSIVIRAEDKNIWEKRTPVIPVDLKEVIDKTKSTAYVQTSSIRCFSDKEYKAQGAITCDDINAGDIIIGIKEIPEHKLLNDKVYLFFSHTIKGQSGGMPLLKKIMDSGSTLIDYERIVDENNRRLIYFGRFAGDAGTLDILWLLGEYWEHQGIHTPFIKCKQSTQYKSLNEAKESIVQIANIIKREGIDKAISPLVIGILGYGNVASGAKEILDCLNVKMIKPNELSNIAEDCYGECNTIYFCEFREEDLVKKKFGKPFDLQEYYKHPENYVNVFDNYLPFLTVIINGVYWDKAYPNFVTWNGLKKLYEKNERPKLCGIADISCDANGAIECNVKYTSIDHPAYLVDPITREITDGWRGDGIVMLAVDNLPAELPYDSSTFFSNRLKKFLPNIIEANYQNSLEQSGLCPEIKKAVIVYKGELTPEYEYLKKFIY